MKIKLLFLTAVFVVFLGVSARVSAQSVPTDALGEDVLPDAGVTPSSPFHFFDRFGDWARLNLLTFNQVRKAEIKVEIAEERLAELKAVVLEGASEEIVAEAEVVLAAGAEEVEADVSRLEGEGRNIADLTEKFSRLSLRHQAVIEEVLEKAPDASKEALTKALEISKRGLEKAGEAVLKQLEKGNLDKERAEKIKERTIEQLKKQIEKKSEVLEKDKEELGEVPQELQERFSAQLQLLERELVNVESKEEFKELREKIRENLKETAEDARELRRIHNIRNDGSEKVLESVVSGSADIAVRVEKVLSEAREETAELESKIAEVSVGGKEIPARVSSLLDAAKKHLETATAAFEAKDFGRAYGQSTSALQNAKNGNKFFEDEDLDEDRDEKVLEKIEEASKKIAEAERKIEEFKSKGGEVPAEALRIVEEAKKQVVLAKEALAKSDFALALRHAEFAKKVVEKIGVLLERARKAVNSETSNTLRVETKTEVKSEDVRKPANTAPTAARQPQVHQVTITAEGFLPRELEIRKGDTVVWTNTASKPSWPASAMHPTHDVYPEKGGCIASAFDACKGLAEGESFKFQFNQIGTWKYHDHLNTSVFGAV